MSTDTACPDCGQGTIAEWDRCEVCGLSYEDLVAADDFMGRDVAWSRRDSEFILKIALGNATMTYGGDVAAALEALAQRLREQGWNASPAVLDHNGNTVGRWEIEMVQT